jgi:translation initiation factor 2 alpha subunit (eIF-2alpha)
MGKYNLNVRISQEYRQIIDEYCGQEGMTQSELVRKFVRSLKRKLKKNQNVQDIED